jgi:hypothetical protein
MILGECVFKDVLTTVVVHCKKLGYHSLVLVGICCLSSIAMAGDDIKFSEIDSFTDFLEWVEDEFEQFKGRDKPEESKDLPSKVVSPENSPTAIKEAPALDLTLPEEIVGDESNYQLKEHQSLSMPDLFSKTVKDEDASTTSFGGRLLMDEGFDELEQYRLQDIKNSIQGAELTFEVKTN